MHTGSCGRATHEYTVHCTHSYPSKRIDTADTPERHRRPVNQSTEPAHVGHSLSKRCAQCACRQFSAALTHTHTYDCQRVHVDPPTIIKPSTAVRASSPSRSPSLPHEFVSRHATPVRDMVPQYNTTSTLTSTVQAS